MRQHRMDGGRAATRRWLPIAATLMVLATGGPTAVATEVGGIELTSPVRQSLRRLQDGWQRWTRAWVENDAEQADAALEEMRLLVEYLGMSRLPDLSIAAATFGVRAARERDFERARWSLAASQELDAGRPETAFATATVKRLQGDYFGAVGATFEAYLKLFEVPFQRTIWLHNVGIWLAYLLLLSGGLYLVLQMGTKGGGLFYDLGRLASPPLPRAAADLVAVFLLIWPLVLPEGVLWLALYWSILLWGYCTLSERVIFVLVWLILGTIPVAVFFQQRQVQSDLMPPTRALQNLASGRLYGELFSDLERLQRLVPGHPAVTEVIGDLHRRFGQWEHARQIYVNLLETGDRGPTAAPALNNIGAYHFRKEDYGTAITYFIQATTADQFAPEPHYNLSLAYSQTYDFNASHQALARAKDLNPTLVDKWQQAATSSEAEAVPIDGGLRRAREIAEVLQSAGRDDPDSSGIRWRWRRFLSFPVALAAIVLAVALHLIRLKTGYLSRKFTPMIDPGSPVRRWLCALLPGWASVVNGHGGRAFAAILLPMAAVTLALVSTLGYRVPIGYGSASGPTLVFSVVALLIVILIRLGLVFKTEG